MGEAEDPDKGLVATPQHGEQRAPVGAQTQPAGKVTRIGMRCATRCEGPGLGQLREGFRGLKTARALGPTIPPAVLLRADRAIE